MRGIYHPCYDPGSAGNPINSYNCNNTYMPDGNDYSDNTKPDFYENAKQSDLWDSCCMYDSAGCPDQFFANFSPTANLDCGGRPDPTQEFTYFSGSTRMCYKVDWLSVGATVSYLDNLGNTVTVVNPPTESNAIPCSLANSDGDPFHHPMGWSKTGRELSTSPLGALINKDCCINYGCKDDGSYNSGQWNNTGTPPTHTVGDYTTTESYYPGHNSTIGVVSPLTILQSPIMASNYCQLCDLDCNNETVGTNNPGWASCCDYVVPGCTETIGTGNPDIFGNGSYGAWNYNPYATLDDGTCYYVEPIVGCIDDGGMGLSTTGGLLPYAFPLYPGIPANNFDPTANVMGGGCTWTNGCPDQLANNYDPCTDPANVPGCGATYPTVPDMSLCDYDIPGAGPGCRDPQALNYNPLATEDCNGIPGDFSCCSYPVEGCTDPNATNYDPLAINDDGSCEYDISTTQEGVNWLYGSKVLLCRDPLTKEEVLMGVCDQPEIQSEIFIERGKQSVIEPNLRLGEIKTMGGLVNHGYKYFRIKKQ